MIRIVADFLWIAVLLSVLLGLLASVVPAIGQSGGLVSAVVGAMAAGMFHGRRTGIVAGAGFAWRAAFAITAAMLALSVIVVEWMRRSGGLPELAGISPAGYALALAAVALLTLLVTRVFFRWGTKLGAAEG